MTAATRWIELRGYLTKTISVRQLSTPEYTRATSLVAGACLCSHASAQTLHDHLKVFITNAVLDIAAEASRVPQEALLHFYCSQWNQFEVRIDICNNIFFRLNKWCQSVPYLHPRDTSRPAGVDGPPEAGKLGLGLWTTWVLEPLVPRLLNLLRGAPGAVDNLDGGFFDHLYTMLPGLKAFGMLNKKERGFVTAFANQLELLWQTYQSTS
ncbi:Uu.00g131710.m01.CDS01 [Anthostomella pinea]|uniref:Uu.00g131710.m01.CDS01 n=1 Tax=Anthostomella pinea TaxID=933095 RepID=A0AAI8YIF1_9PEZI|nr:Uu.00g131710.m01.CDS01 [Anthostomella pinea]